MKTAAIKRLYRMGQMPVLLAERAVGVFTKTSQWHVSIKLNRAAGLRTSEEG